MLWRVIVTDASWYYSVGVNFNYHSTENYHYTVPNFLLGCFPSGALTEAPFGKQLLLIMS